MNILILSVGTRNKIVQYFKKSITGKVVVTDMSPIAPAIFEADSYYIVPAITAPNYIDMILDICIKEKINAVMSLIDPELSLLAQNIDRFSGVGVMVIGSSYELCEMSLDKMKMFAFCRQNGFNCAESYESIAQFESALRQDRISFPVFVKPIRGSASINISKIDNMELLNVVFKQSDQLMIQQYLRGQEIGADVYIDMVSGEIVSIFTKKKILMRAGETDKAVSFKEDRLFEYIERFVKVAGFRGQIDIDLFDIDGEYYISEVNPRFGGGYPHAYECGCDHMKLIENNVNGIANTRQIGNYQSGIYMMKYNEIKICQDIRS